VLVADKEHQHFHDVDDCDDLMYGVVDEHVRLPIEKSFVSMEMNQLAELLEFLLLLLKLLVFLLQVVVVVVVQVLF